MREYWFVLDLNPEPWAIGPVGYSRRGGKMSAYVGRNQQLDAYKQAIKEALDFEGPMLEGKVTLNLWFWRHRAEYETPQARTHRKHEADATNLQKSTEDALQGVLFANDKDVRVVRSVVVDQGPEVVGRIVIHVREQDPLVYHGYTVWPHHVQEMMDKLDGQGTMELDFDDDEYRSTGEDLF